MKPSPFAYRRPASIPEAAALCADHPGAKILAGGQSLVPLLSMRLAAPPMLVDINGLVELDSVDAAGDGVRVGALARHTRVLTDSDAARTQPLLPLALGYVAHPTIRNRGTVLGSVVHADPSAEMPAVVALLDGTVTAVSTSGSRDIPASELFAGPLESTLRPDEIATHLWIPALPAASGVAFTEVARRNGDYALCGVAAVTGTERTAVSYLGVCDVPTVVDVTEAVGEPPWDDSAYDRAAEQATAVLDPPSDIHATAEYRGHLARVLTTRALREAQADRARRGAPSRV